jgi:methionyl-tRNA formyltransferase
MHNGIIINEWSMFVKIIFMGTPDFAVPAINALINSKNHSVVAVFTAAPKPQGRGMKRTKSPVHQIAMDNKIDIYTPSTLRNSEIQSIIHNIEADIIVVAAYGFIVPKEILAAKKYGCINIHPSLLPGYRGAAPLQWSIINGDKESAMCIMQMDEGLDTGDIILQQNFPMPARVTFKELHDMTANLGAQLLLRALDEIDSLPRIPQDDTNATYAHKLTKEDGKINWEESAYKIDCKVRGMNPWPGVYFEYKGKIIKITESDYYAVAHNFIPGTMINGKLDIACKEGILKITKLKLEGKKEITAEEFTRGYMHVN